MIRYNYKYLENISPSDIEKEKKLLILKNSIYRDVMDEIINICNKEIDKEVENKYIGYYKNLENNYRKEIVDKDIDLLLVGEADLDEDDLKKVQNLNNTIENFKTECKELNLQLINVLNKQLEPEIVKNIIPKCEKRIDELEALDKNLKEYKRYTNCFLLRGNPGIGKSSFIIYLLYMLKEYSCIENEFGHRLNIYYYKNLQKNKPAKFKYEDGKLIYKKEEPKEEDIDIIISDSYNYDVCHKDHLLILYISSPNDGSYSNFSKQTRGERKKLYLDVFSPTEIEEWRDFCLPDYLREYIKNNKTAEKYGNIPRHIYFDALHMTCYGRDYWDEIYSIGMNAI